jgi:hypothetical protein
MSEQDRMSYPQGGDSAVADARAEREHRLAETEAALAAGACPGHAEQTLWHSGQPTPAVQQTTHGQPAPSVPDEGGHQSAGDPIG